MDNRILKEFIVKHLSVEDFGYLVATDCERLNGEAAANIKSKFRKWEEQRENLAVPQKKYDDSPLSMIEELEENDSKLTDWERNFLDSISKWLARPAQLSERQSETLLKIYSKVIL